MTRIITKIELARLAGEIKNATSRIVDLMRSFKEYSFMDKAPQPSGRRLLYSMRGTD